jgi:hypothetical protein
MMVVVSIGSLTARLPGAILTPHSDQSLFLVGASVGLLTLR